MSGLNCGAYKRFGEDGIEFVNQKALWRV